MHRTVPQAALSTKQSNARTGALRGRQDDGRTLTLRW